MRDPHAVIELLRHGEPVGGNRVRGRVDDPLSELGWEQMQRAVEPCAGWAHIVTSPLQRCAAFAEHLARRGETSVSVEQRFAEIDFGEWEGQPPDVLWTRAPERVRSFFADPIANSPPGGEAFADFQARVAAAWQCVVDRAEGRWLIVAHGGTIRVILSSVLQIPARNMFSLEVGYACLSRLAVYTDGAQARRVVLRSHV